MHYNKKYKFCYNTYQPAHLHQQNIDVHVGIIIINKCTIQFSWRFWSIQSKWIVGIMYFPNKRKYYWVLLKKIEFLLFIRLEIAIKMRSKDQENFKTINFSRKKIDVSIILLEEMLNIHPVIAPNKNSFVN